MTSFGTEDPDWFVKFLGELPIPFVLRGVGAILVAGGAVAMAARLPSVVWLGLVVVRGDLRTRRDSRVAHHPDDGRREPLPA